MINLNCFNRVFLALFVSISVSLVASAANSEEDTLKLIQQAKYNVFTGNWDVHLDLDIKTIEQGIKNSMPGLDYTLVDEKVSSPMLSTLIFRGAGDQKVAIKLKRYEAFTNVRIRVGLTGNESKSAQIFSYIYRKM
ncbi:MAG: DUF3568 family protein [Opitutaceae bacterium]|nr:DUF3568 family protein [Opitutaceae bacterium]